jgi:hypothetical protein
MAQGPSIPAAAAERELVNSTKAGLTGSQSGGCCRLYFAAGILLKLES